MTITERRIRVSSSFPEEVAIARARAAEPTHYKCPDCFQPCRCTGDARLLPHQRCGQAAERS